jgi:hypothetical protein
MTVGDLPLDPARIDAESEGDMSLRLFMYREALTGLRARIEALATSHEQTADIHAENAEEWRKRSTALAPFAIQIAERAMLAINCRSIAAGLRAILRESEAADAGGKDDK